MARRVEREPSLRDVATRYRSDLEECRSRLVSGIAAIPERPVLEAYLSGGRMFRALLTLVSSKAVGGRAADAMSAAEAIELVHAASLIHDDIIDGAEQRRGDAPLHVRLGVPAAIVVGDDLLLDAVSRLARGAGALAVEAIKMLVSEARGCCLGELFELASSADIGVTEEEYFTIARGKTAAHIAAAAALGGLLGGAKGEQIAALRAFGVDIGIAYQIRDDLLDIGGSDSSAARPLYPIILLRKLAPGAADEWPPRTEREHRRVLRLLRDSDVEAHVARVQKRLIRSASAALVALGSEEVTEELRCLARFAADTPPLDALGGGRSA
jgi:geranylgeranyl pyrophosphate synthase